MTSRFAKVQSRYLCALLLACYPCAAIAKENEALASLRTSYPQVKVLRQGTHITRLYEGPFSTGSDARESAERFRQDHARVFRVSPQNLVPSVGPSRGFELPLMPDRQTGANRFTLLTYQQQQDGVPVFRSELRLLVRNEESYPLVLAVSSLRDLGHHAFAPGSLGHLSDPQLMAVAFAKGQSVATGKMPELASFGVPLLVIWAGTDETIVDLPRPALMFEAGDSLDHFQVESKWLLLTDFETGEVLYRENELLDAEVSGHVSGWGLAGVASEICEPEINYPLPYAEVRFPADTVYTDIFGDYSFDVGVAPSVLVESPTGGRYFSVSSQGGPTVLSQMVAPPGVADFVHNLVPTAENRAEVNAYVFANAVRDYVLEASPAFPVIGSQTGFPISVNEPANGLCPGNAQYTGVGLRFCAGGSGYPNTAWSSIIYHEYGHHVVEMGGSGQGQYAEGLADALSVLLLDDPRIGLGLTGSCQTVTRSAANSFMYPCSDIDPHVCGNVLSGCIWDTRNELVVSNPSTYLEILGDLLVNSVLLHAGSSITPAITIDFLTLDDDDADIGNGTPHSAEILAGFGAHNMSPLAPPTNDACIDAIPVCPGITLGSTFGATADGSSTCARSNPSPDVWYRYTPTSSGGANVSLCGPQTNYDSAISVHTGCPGQVYDEVVCDDDGCGTTFGPSEVNFFAVAGETYFIRVMGFLGSVGDFKLTLTGPACVPELPAALTIRFPKGRPASVPPNVGTPVKVKIKPGSEQVQPGTETLRYRSDGGAFQTIPLIKTGVDSYEAMLPQAICSAAPQYYISAEGDGGSIVKSPGSAPVDYYEAYVGVPQTQFIDTFESDLGWVVSGSVFEGDWERGVPVNNNRGDPDSDYDGSGQCYLTENDPSDPNSDVDLGTTILTSPPFDMTTGGVISYAYWIDDGPGFLDEDYLVVEVSTDAGGIAWTPLRAHTVAQPIWKTDEIFVGTEVPASDTVRVRFLASDLAVATIIECAVDSVRVDVYACDDSGTCDDGVLNQDEDRIDCGGVCDPCACLSDTSCDDGLFCTGTDLCNAWGMCETGGGPCTSGHWCDETGDECVDYGDGDFDYDGDVDLWDFGRFQSCFGSWGTGPCSPGNLSGSGLIDLLDFDAFSGSLTPPNERYSD